MKNQNQNQKSVVHLRVFEPYGNSATIAYDRGGAILNKNQLVKIMHSTLEWDNYLKNIKFLGIVDVKVERLIIKNAEGEWVDSEESKLEYQHELNVARFGKENADAMRSELEKEYEIPKTELEVLKDEYKELFNKKVHHTWSEELIKEKINEFKTVTA